MMKKLLVGLAIGLPIFMSMATGLEAMTAAGNDQASGPALSAKLGHADFLRYCAACHGATGVGDGAVAEFLTVKPANLTLLTKNNAGKFPRERISEVIDGRIVMKVHGLRDMPIWGDWFTREAKSDRTAKSHVESVVAARIRALVDYIETIQTR